jgi:hypothetical protein
MKWEKAIGKKENALESLDLERVLFLLLISPEYRQPTCRINKNFHISLRRGGFNHRAWLS